MALNELKDSTGNPAVGTERYNFKVGGQNVEPQYHVYSVGGKNKETYTYTFGNKELYLYLNYGIPNQADFDGAIRVSVDGQEFLSASAKDQSHEPEMFGLYLERGNELTITIEGNETLWDVGFREMNYFWDWTKLRIF